MKNIFILYALVLITNPISGQINKKAVTWHVGISAAFTAHDYPEYTLPVGFGINATATLKSINQFEPTAEFKILAFPEYVIRVFNNGINTNYSKYAYAFISLVAGTKYKFNNHFNAVLQTGISNVTNDKVINFNLQPAIEYAIKKDKLLLNMYYAKIINKSFLNGYIGFSVLFKIR